MIAEGADLGSTSDIVQRTYLARGCFLAGACVSLTPPRVTTPRVFILLAGMIQHSGLDYVEQIVPAAEMKGTGQNRKNKRTAMV